jgi:serine/threonine-protein kinase HipA
MTDQRDRLLVYLDAQEFAPMQRLGSLTRERAASRRVVSFAYEPQWLAASDAFALDPALPLYEGEQYSVTLPGIFSDAAPDRWGRTLLERREALMARRERRRPRRLDDWDFLVQVNDATRMGAVRLVRSDNGAFVDDAPLSVPPSTHLRELEHWARELEGGLPRATTDEERWISMLIAPGSSLGGARPKANFRGEDGALWIAKFPSQEDRHDVGAWEYVVTHLAADAGIDVPEAGLLRLGSTYRTFTARRFDRSGGSRRLYASAMTLAGKRDNDNASYLDIAQAIERSGDPGRIVADLEQLFRRAAFNVLVANRDDHLRNHGFLRSNRGWRLAPAFDVNPTPEKLEHALALDGTLRVPDIEVVRETAPLYRLSGASADEIVADVRRAVGGWRKAAGGIGIPREEIERLADAFEE